MPSDAGVPAQANPSTAWIRWPIAGIVLSVAAVLAYQYFAAVDYPWAQLSISRHHEIVTGVAESPYRYRVLVPFLAEPVIAALAHGLAYRTAFLAVYLLFDFLAIGFSLFALLAYLREYFDERRALIGVLFVAAVMVLGFRNHYFMPWSLLEPGLFSLSLWVIRRDRRIAFLVLTVLATLNRETGFMLPLAFAVTGPQRADGQGPRPRFLLGALLGFAAWAAVFVGVRALAGAAPGTTGPAALWVANLQPLHLARTVVNVALFGGAFWIFAALGFRRSPAFVRRAMLVVPPYLAGVACFGMWYEVRLLVTLYPVLVPPALFYLFPQDDAAPAVSGHHPSARSAGPPAH